MLPAEVRVEFRKVFKRLAIIVGLLAFSAMMIGNKDVVVGIIVGGSMSMLNFRLLAINTVQLLELKDPKTARARAIVQYVIRYIMMAGVMYVGFITPEINFVALVIGMMLVKYVILFDGIYNSLKNWISEFWKNQKLKYERRDS